MQLCANSQFLNSPSCHFQTCLFLFGSKWSLKIHHNPPDKSPYHTDPKQSGLKKIRPKLFCIKNRPKNSQLHIIFISKFEKETKTFQTQGPTAMVSAFFDKFEHFSQNKYCYKTFVFDFNEVKEVSSMLFWAFQLKFQLKLIFKKQFWLVLS